MRFIADVMVSSTVLDLPLHREQVRDACIRMSMFPLTMEDLPALDATAIEKSLQMVNRADVYIGIFAGRYGHIPHGYSISITEMEYLRAVERGIPRLIFLESSDPTGPGDRGAGDQLSALKDRLKAERVCSFFSSLDGLRAEVIHALSVVSDKVRRSDLLRPVIPSPPTPYIPHPYTLLQQRSLTGRREEITLLNDWCLSGDKLAEARVLSIVALGGTGKSALAWTWFNNLPATVEAGLSGRLWWSFYEPNAGYESLLGHAFAYITGRHAAEVRHTDGLDIEDTVVQALSSSPFLLALDGLERELVTYNASNNAAAEDNEVGSLLLSEQGRRFADPRMTRFLQRILVTGVTRVLITSRLMPSDLETAVGNPMPGSQVHHLSGLTKEDALALWQAFGLPRTSSGLPGLFRSFGNHPLVIRALASEVANFRRAPGDFDAWRRLHPDFVPQLHTLASRRSHILKFALKNLQGKPRQVLEVISLLRMPATYDALLALVAETGTIAADEVEVDRALVDLENRGLVGWNRADNCYDLHPLVRSTMRSQLPAERRQALLERNLAHYRVVSMPSWTSISSVNDISAQVETFHALVDLGRFDEALERVWDKQLHPALTYHLGSYRLTISFLERLFPNGFDEPPSVKPEYRSYAYAQVAQSYFNFGELSKALLAYNNSEKLSEQHGLVEKNFLADSANIAPVLLLLGRLRDAENRAWRGIIFSRLRQERIQRRDHWMTADLFIQGNPLRAAIGDEGILLRYHGAAFAQLGQVENATACFERSMEIHKWLEMEQSVAVTALEYGQLAIHCGQHAQAEQLADLAWETAHVRQHARDITAATRLRGAVALMQGDLIGADTLLHRALASARSQGTVEVELETLIVLVELHRHRREFVQAHTRLEDIWPLAERGPFRCIMADAGLALAQLRLDEDKPEFAEVAAVEAYRSAWCDGPPFAYHWGLIKARKLLAQLGVAEPTLS